MTTLREGLEQYLRIKVTFESKSTEASALVHKLPLLMVLVYAYFDISLSRFLGFGRSRFHQLLSLNSRLRIRKRKIHLIRMIIFI